MDVAIRPVEPGDVDTLCEFLEDPETKAWWGTPTPEEDREEVSTGFAILVDAELAGWIGVDEETTPDYQSVGLDIMLGPGLCNRGVGPRALRLAIDQYVEKGHHRFTIDPSAANTRAIRAYEKVGFKPVGIMR
nr:GNAT family N-acetyltransferase [Thermoleophilaceae bacterium]